MPASSVTTEELSDCTLIDPCQVAALCGVHCINTLLQGPYFSELDLAQARAALLLVWPSWTAL